MSRCLGSADAEGAEKVDLSEFGISHNRCIDPELICRLSPELEPLIRNSKTDKGQRSLCGCITSKDIGTYNTCPHGCAYCYANIIPASERFRPTLRYEDISAKLNTSFSTYPRNSPAILLILCNKSSAEILSVRINGSNRQTTEPKPNSSTRRLNVSIRPWSMRRLR